MKTYRAYNAKGERIRVTIPGSEKSEERGGIVVVEDANTFEFQIIGQAVNMNEALELANDFRKRATPDNPNVMVVPNEYYLIYRNDQGYYTKKILLKI